MMNRVEMLNHIDAKAGFIRSKFITIAPGQEATYILKAQQARAFALAGFVGPVPGLIAAEMAATGLDAQTVTTRIQAEESAWAMLAGGIENIRRSGKVAVQSAPSDEVALAAFNSTINALISLLEH
jgi:hypothetical protein